MKRKCDKCDRPATYHSVEIVDGQKIEKHLCEHHAAQEGLAQLGAKPAINQLLTNFVKMHSGEEDVAVSGACPHCGMTFEQFRETSLMGCPQCYEALGEDLSPLIERAQQGATHHVGKLPQRAGGSTTRQSQLLHLRKRLQVAVEAEDYESAATLRDEIGRVEENLS